MRKSTIGWLVGLGLLGLAGAGLATRAEAQGRGRLGLLQNYARHWDDAAPQVNPGRVLAYGPAPQQTLAFWPARGLKPGVAAPLVLFVHGGDWSRGDAANGTGRWKEAHFPGTGVAFATIDYRLVPQAGVEDEAADVAHAVAKVIQAADSLGVDRRRIVLMGHSAGAHLVALVGTDERYLRAAGLSLADLAGVVAIDGAAYDVPAQMRDGPAIMQRTYGAAFGGDAARQAALSPTVQAGAPNVARFLLLHVQRPDGVQQAEALARALVAGGSQVERVSLPGQGLLGHIEINRRLGEPGYAATRAVDEWLAALFSRG